MKSHTKWILSFIIIILALVGTIGFMNFNDALIVDLKLNGVTVESDIHTINFLEDNDQMNSDITNYVKEEMINENSTVDSIKSGVSNITKKYGYTNTEINIRSEFGDDTLPMFFNVEGTSMLPTFHDGESVIINKTHDVSVGDCVVADSPEYGRIIKRVSQINGNEVYLTSDNKEVKYRYEDGYTIKEEGIKTWVNKNNIIGVVKISNITNNTNLNV